MLNEALMVTEVPTFFNPYFSKATIYLFCLFLSNTITFLSLESNHMMTVMENLIFGKVAFMLLYKLVNVRQQHYQLDDCIWHVLCLAERICVKLTKELCKLSDISDKNENKQHTFLMIAETDGITVSPLTPWRVIVVWINTNDVKLIIIQASKLKY